MSQEQLSFRDVERMKTEGDLNGLRQALTDGDVEIRRATVQALGQLKAREAVAALIGMLHDEDFLVQKAAIEALGQIGDARAVEPLIAAVKDEDELVPVYAAEALISIYRRGGIDENSKRRILALRKEMAAQHYDKHTDEGPECGGHCDRGVEGIEFLV